MAGLAGRAPHIESRGLARLLQGPHRVKSIPYEDTVREALCFGWIDSLIKRLDEACSTTELQHVLAINEPRLSAGLMWDI